MELTGALIVGDFYRCYNIEFTAVIAVHNYADGKIFCVWTLNFS
jgi:hypothetical protein